jgi:hypothetical protein
MSGFGFNVDDVPAPDAREVAKMIKPAQTGARTSLNIRGGSLQKATQRIVLLQRVEKAFIDAEGRKPNANDSEFWRLHTAIQKGQVTNADLRPTSDTGDATSRSGPGYSSSPFPDDFAGRGNTFEPNAGEPMEKVDYTTVPVPVLRKLAIGGDAQAADELHRRGLPIGSAPNVDADELHKSDQFGDRLRKALDNPTPHNSWIRKIAEENA